MFMYRVRHLGLETTVAQKRMGGYVIRNAKVLISE
jgi:hypothetical protein